MDDFAACLAESGAHSVWLLPVYAASEEPLPGASHEALAARARSLGHARVEALGSIPEAVERLANWAESGDTVMIQGAGDVTKAADLLARRLAS
jgi:UDP-N-acetylmuramate--alanine ligase